MHDKEVVATGDIFEKLFDKWVKEKKLDKETVDISFKIPNRPAFGSYDAWKLANSEDYFREKTHAVNLDTESLRDYMHDVYDEEVLGEVYSNESEIDKSFTELMDTGYKRWLKGWEEKMSEKYAEEYADNESERDDF